MMRCPLEGPYATQRRTRLHRYGSTEWIVEEAYGQLGVLGRLHSEA